MLFIVLFLNYSYPEIVLDEFSSYIFERLNFSSGIVSILFHHQLFCTLHKSAHEIIIILIKT